MLGESQKSRVKSPKGYRSAYQKSKVFIDNTFRLSAYMCDLLQRLLVKSIQQIA